MRYITERLEDFIAGFVTAAIGAFIIFEASNYKLGSLDNIGPGFFPTILGWCMLFLAVFMVITARKSETPQPIGRDQLRGMLFVTAGFIAFAYTVEAAGMIVSVFLGVFLSALGNRRTPIPTALLLAISTAVVSTLIFSVGLGIQIKAF